MSSSAAHNLFYSTSWFIYFSLQISELSDLADRPLVGALTSRLQALHTQLQAFVERVDGLGKPQTGVRDAQVEGASPVASTCTSLSFSADNQDRLNTAEEKVTDMKHTPPLHPVSLLSLSFIISWVFFSFWFRWVSFSILQFCVCFSAEPLSLAA